MLGMSSASQTQVFIMRRRKRYAVSPPRTFYPAGFNMAEADKMIDYHYAKKEELKRLQNKDLVQPDMNINNNWEFVKSVRIGDGNKEKVPSKIDIMIKYFEKLKAPVANDSKGIDEPAKERIIDNSEITEIVARGDYSRKSEMLKEKHSSTMPSASKEFVPETKSQERVLEAKSNHHLKPLFVSEKLKDVCLLHGIDEDFKSIELKNAGLGQSIHNALEERGIVQLRSLQKFAWPIILKRRNMVLLSAPRSGKTLSYAAPFAQFLIEQRTCGRFPPGNGPVLLILGSGPRWIEEVEKVVKHVMEPYEDIRIMSFTGGGKTAIERNLQIDFVNGYEVLITTPMYLERLLKYEQYAVNFYRLRYFVLDDIDVLTHKYFSEVKYICEEISVALKNKLRVSKDIQIVLTGQKWCANTERLVKRLPSPVICITSFLEAAVYAHLKPDIHILNNKDKMSKLFELISDEVFRTVIACNNVDELVSIKKEAEKQKMNFFHFMHEDMQQLEIRDVMLQWDKSIFPKVLVATDGILKDIHVKKASCLIHYSLPEKSKTTFGIRFVCLFENFPHLMKSSEEKQSLPIVHLFIDQSVRHQLPVLTEFLNRLGVKINPELAARKNQALQEKELQKVNVPLCNNIKTLGECWIQFQCNYRHLICDYDKLHNDPRSGLLKVLLLFPYSVCHFAARLLEHDLDGKKTHYPNMQIVIARKLADYFKMNRSVAADPKVWEIYGVKCTQNIFQRAQILSTEQLDKDNCPVTVRVRFLDVGNVEVIEVTDIYDIPKEIKDIQAQTVELVLCGLCPHDKDWNWNDKAVTAVNRIISEVKKQDIFVVANIKASIASVIWVDKLVSFQKLPAIKSYVRLFSFRSRLVEEGLAMENAIHLKLLQPILEEGGIKVSEEKTVTAAPQEFVPEKQTLNVQYAFLPSEEVCTVSFVTAINPSAFFVTRTKFEDLLDKLTDKIVQLVEQKKKCGHTLLAGDYCVGKSPNEVWCRALVESIEGNTLDLFFVDYGDNAFVPKSDAFCATCFDGIFAELPFQAIECELACISPDEEDGQWSDNATNTLWELASFKDDDESLELYAKVVEKKPAKCPGAVSYSIVLVDVRRDETCIVNQLMVTRGFARQSMEQKNVLDKINLSSIVISCELVVVDDDGDEVDEDYRESGKAVRAIRAANSDAVEEYMNTVDSFKAEFGLNFDMIDEEEAKYMNNILKVQAAGYWSAQRQEQSQRIKEVNFETQAISDSKADDFPTMNPLGTVEHREDMPPLERMAFHPCVKWRQDSYFVWLEVDVPGVTDYYLGWDVMSIEFGAKSNDKCYVFDMKLFGAVDPRRVKHQGGGLCVKIKLQKLQYGVPWLRLLYDTEKQNWIQYDVSSLGSEDRTLDEELYKLRERLNKDIVPVSKKPVLSWSSSDAESEDDERDLCDERDLADGADIANPKLDLDMIF